MTTTAQCSHLTNSRSHPHAHQKRPDRRDSHPHRAVVCPHRSVLVDHGSWCGDAVLCESLLSYGARWRAANAHARLKKNWKSRRDSNSRPGDLITLDPSARCTDKETARDFSRSDQLSYDPSWMSDPFAPPTRGECGTARAPEGSVLRVASVVRRRRDVTADAPSSGSRVRLCSLHHVTPADGAPRWCMTACVACVFPDHRLSISGCERRDSQCRSSTRIARSG